MYYDYMTKNTIADVFLLIGLYNRSGKNWPSKIFIHPQEIVYLHRCLKYF